MTRERYKVLDVRYNVSYSREVGWKVYLQACTTEKLYLLRIAGSATAPYEKGSEITLDSRLVEPTDAAP